MARASDQVCVAAALADCGSLPGSGKRNLQIARFELRLDRGQQQIAALGALTALLLEQASGAGKPAGRAAGLVAHEQAKAEPERAANGARHLADVQVSLKGAPERGEVI